MCNEHEQNQLKPIFVQVADQEHEIEETIFDFYMEEAPLHTFYRWAIGTIRNILWELRFATTGFGKSCDMK